MKNLRDVEVKLNDIHGFKRIFKGLRRRGKIKKSFEIYDTATKKGVYELIKLREAHHDDISYAIYILSLNLSITQEDIDLIKKRVENVSLGTVRYECMWYARLEKWRGESWSRFYESTELTGIAPEYTDVFIIPVFQRIDCTAVIYANKDNENYMYPITDKQIKSILS